MRQGLWFRSGLLLVAEIHEALKGEGVKGTFKQQRLTFVNFLIIWWDVD